MKHFQLGKSAKWLGFRISDIFISDWSFFYYEFNEWLGKIKDPRQPWKIKYSLVQVLHEGLFLFLFQLKSRRAVTFELRSFEALAQNLSRYFQVLCSSRGVKKGRDELPHGDALAYVLERVNPEEVASAVPQMVGALIRNKCFLRERVLGAYYLFVVDGTELYSFRERHCEYCLTKRVGKRRTQRPFTIILF